MVTALLRELAGPYPPFFPFEELWHLYHHAPQHLVSAWENACRRALQTGDAEELHATRNDYQALLLGHLKVLDGHLMLFQCFLNEYPHRQFEERMRRTRDALQRHYDALFPRWQTIDDLEALLLERASISNEQLKALAAAHAPPQAWYDEPDTAAKE